MKQKLTPHRRAAALLLTAAALPLTPLAAQEVPTVNAPPPVTTIAPPAPAPAEPPATAPTPMMAPQAAVRGPTVEHQAPSGAEPARAAPRAAPATRAPVRTARAAPPRAAPLRQAAPAPAPAPATAAAPAATASGVTAGATPQVAPASAPPATSTIPAASARRPAQTGIPTWQWLLAAAAIAIIAIAAAVAIVRRRRSADDAYYEEAYYEEPAYAAPAEPIVAAEPIPVAEPIVAAAPVAAAAEEVSVTESDRADVDALAASSEPAPNRPWLEFLMRPVRAGTSEDEARVEFELTVGNTGSLPARDVRVSTWMVAGGQGTDMERSLIEPPADAAQSEMDIAPGDGARVEGAISVPRGGLHGAVLPVVVADARYRLPDGSEGRTHASFAVGLSSGDGLAPFDADSPTGIRDDVEARLHGEPERV